MQILSYGGKLQGKNSGGAMFNVAINYEIDMTDHDRTPGQNFVVLQQTIDDGTNDTDVDGSAANKLLVDQHEEHFGNTFRVNERYTLNDFITFAKAKNLRLAIKDSNGAHHETLVSRDASDSL